MSEPVQIISDRRESERRILRTTAHMLVQGQPLIETRTLDISRTGLGVVAATNVPPHEMCRVRVVIPQKPKGSSVFEVNAKIMYSIFSSSVDGFKIGLNFTDVSPELSSAISRFFKGG